MPAASQGGAGVGQLAGQGHLAVAGHGRADVGQRLPGQPLDLGDLGLGPVRVEPDQPAGQLGLDRDDGQRVAEDVVQVAGEPVALVLDRQPGDLLAGRGQLAVALR